MSLRSQYYSDLAAGRDVSGHPGRPTPPQEHCAEPAIGPPDDDRTYRPCGDPAVAIVADRDGRTYAMCQEHADRFKATRAYLQATEPIDSRD